MGNKLSQEEVTQFDAKGYVAQVDIFCRGGLGFSYIPTNARSTNKTRLTAALVRGVDEFGYYDDEPQPQADYGSTEQEFHRDAVARFRVER